MTATVRLNDALSKTLDRLSESTGKKKSEIIREAIVYYSQRVERSKKRKLLDAVAKVKQADKKEIASLEGTLGDGI